MDILYGKPVAENIRKNFSKRLETLKVNPNIAVIGIKGDSASNFYINNIKKNCKEYGIGFNLILVNNSIEFEKEFNNIKLNESITGIILTEPLEERLFNLINEIPSNKDIEGISVTNMGKLFLGRENAMIPCTSKAVMEVLDYYGIDLEGKKVVIVGRSNIVGKPLIPQILKKNATVTICHSKTKNLLDETSKADVVIMAIGKANFLKKEMIKKDSILIDVGINFLNGRICGDIDFEDVKEKVKAATPVPGGIGVVTNAVLIDNIIKSVE